VRAREAAYIGSRLGEIPVDELSPILNLGSSNLTFRSHTHPHVDQSIFRPLAERGARIIHADLRDEEGVELIGDIYDPDFQARCRELGSRTVICCNILEHVVDPQEFAHVVSRLVPIGGYLVVSVPNSYPFHADPIDTGFRPTPEEIQDLFGAEYSPIACHLLTDSTWLEDLRREMPGHKLLSYFAKDLAKAVRELRSANRFRRLHRYLWLLRAYKISIVILRKAA
jgi:hypothetical protein